MDERTRNLKGSPARDAFKHWHKSAGLFPAQFYSMDLDLALITKSPPKIKAVIDYKEWHDKSPTFAEVIGYNHLLSLGIAVYIVRSSYLKGFEDLSIWQYLGGDWRPYPPKCELKLLIEHCTPIQFVKWETSIRSAS